MVKCDKIKIFLFLPEQKRKTRLQKVSEQKNQIISFLSQSDYQNGNVGR